MAYELRLDPQGRLHVPVRLRNKLGLKPGDTAVVNVEDDRLIVERPSAIAHRLRGCLKGAGRGSAVEQLIEERRKEAADISR